MRCLDLFSGIGGFSLGLERAGMKTVAFCEYDKHAQRVLRKHWPEVPIFEDVRTLTKGQLDHDGITDIDVICGGPPCQDISNAGRKAGLEGERSGLWFEYFRIISEIRPRYALIENVASLAIRGLDRILSDLASIGFDAEWDCIGANRMGAPHERKRIWIVAYPQRLRPQRQGGYFDALYPTPDAYREASGLVDAFQGDSLPYVCRGHDGRTPKLDEARLKMLGNAVVPQIPEVIGRFIMEIENGT